VGGTPVFPFEDREARRRTVVLKGTLIHDRQSYPCRVRDLSAGGCKVESDANLPPATPLHIELSDYGRFPAVIAWAEGRAAGLVFAEGTAGALARFGERAELLGLVDPDGREAKPATPLFPDES
jgi:hypothetical protein